MKAIILQKNSHDHIACILKNIVLQLDVSVTFSTIDKTVRKHPLHPLIHNLNDILNNWGIATEPHKTTFKELMELTLPTLIRTGSNRENYLLITQVNDQSITYIDTIKGLVTCNHYLFEQSWDGTVETIVLKQDCGEKHFQENCLTEKKERNKRLYLIIITLILTMGCFFRGFQSDVHPMRWVSLYILELLGGLSALTGLWKKAQKQDCVNSIEFFAWYFSGSVLSIVLAEWFNQLNTVLTLLSYANMVVAAFSIQQLHKHRSTKHPGYATGSYLTPILLIPAFFSFTILPNTPTLAGYVMLLVCFNIPVAAWFMLKPIVYKQYELSNQLTKMQKYKHPQISRLLLQNAPSIHVPRTNYNIDCGAENANIQFTLFISLTDVKSGNTFLALKKLVSELEQTRLNVKLVPDNTLSDQVIGLVMAYLSNHTSAETVDLIERWYKDVAKNLYDFSIENQIQAYPPTMDSILAEYRMFLQNVKGIAPNTLLINGKLVPDYFDFEDIRFQIVYDPVRLYPAVVTEKEKFWKGKKPVYA